MKIKKKERKRKNTFDHCKAEKIHLGEEIGTYFRKNAHEIKKFKKNHKFMSQNI